MIRDATTEARYAHYRAQRAWYAEQEAYLLSRLAEIPEGDGSMLDHTIVVRISEISDGQTHTHQNMPFYLAGGGCGAIRSGAVVNTGGADCADLWIAVAEAMGVTLTRFGDRGRRVLPGVLA
jgi:hypothetical protein